MVERIAWFVFATYDEQAKCDRSTFTHEYTLNDAGG